MQQKPKLCEFELIQSPFNVSKSELEITDKDLLKNLKNETQSKKINKFADEFFRKYVNFVYKISIIACNHDVEEAKDLTMQTFDFALCSIKDPSGFNIPDTISLKKYGLILKTWLSNIAKFKQKRAYSEKTAALKVNDFTPGIDQIICPVCSEFLQNEKNKIYCVNGHYVVKTDRKRFAETILVEPSEPPRDTSGKPLDSDHIADSDELRNKFNNAKEKLSEKERVIFDAYLEEGCFANKLHLKDSTMQRLCKTYNTNPASIRQIKLRTFKKIKKYCLQI